MKPFRERNPVIIGAISIAAIVLLLVASFKAQDLPLIGGGDTYEAEFEDTAGLRPDDEVRMAGVRIGTVEDIKIEDGKVRVSFNVKTDEEFGDQTAASIQVKTLLGAMYLSLEPAGKGQLEEGALIPADRTTEPFDVVDAFEGLADTIGDGDAANDDDETGVDIDTDQLAQSMTVLADLTRNTPEEFRTALDGLSRLSSNLADRDGQINSLLKNLKRVSTVLDDRDEDIVQIMKDSDVLFEALVQRREQVHRILVSTQTLSRELTTLVRQSRADLNPALTELKRVLDVLNKNEDNIDNSLRLLAPFYRVFANTLGTGPWFDTYIENLPPLPVLGQEASP